MKKRNYILLLVVLFMYRSNTGLHAQQCSLYNILSTGFNRTTQTPYTIPSGANNGGFDSYWNVMKKQDLSMSFGPGGIIYTPSGAVTTFVSGTLPYVVPPYSSPGLTSPTIGTARHISLNSTNRSVYQGRNIVTFRTYFSLPSPIPPTTTYSMSFAIAADDAVYEVNVHGVSIKQAGFNGPGGKAYIQQGPPMYLLIDTYNTPGAFLPGSNYIEITIGDLGLVAIFTEAEILLYQCTNPAPPTCSECISSFAPIPGKKYVVSAWTKEKNAVQSKTSYTFPSINILYPSISGSAGPFSPAGSIIDGWQRIEGEFVIPSNATDITLKLNCLGANDCFYDDVRVFPFDGSMKSYVYDPVNMRLVAELDERNYATLYEYDEEGKLIRVKKETEKGKMTIKENRDNTKK